MGTNIQPDTKPFQNLLLKGFLIIIAFLLGYYFLTTWITSKAIDSGKKMEQRADSTAAVNASLIKLNLKIDSNNTILALNQEKLRLEFQNLSTLTKANQEALTKKISFLSTASSSELDSFFSVYQLDPTNKSQP